MIAMFQLMDQVLDCFIVTLIFMVFDQIVDMRTFGKKLLAGKAAFVVCFFNFEGIPALEHAAFQGTIVVYGTLVVLWVKKHAPV